LIRICSWVVRGSRSDAVSGRDALIVKGRMFPVGTCHALEPVDDYIESAARQAIQIHCTSGQDGDVLVFMPGEWSDSSS
jgi:ATP-dependent RNA helicase DHX33